MEHQWDNRPPELQFQPQLDEREEHKVSIIPLERITTHDDHAESSSGRDQLSVSCGDEQSENSGDERSDTSSDRLSEISWTDNTNGTERPFQLVQEMIQLFFRGCFIRVSTMRRGGHLQDVMTSLF